MSEQQSEASTSRPGSPVAPLPDFPTARPYRFDWDASKRQGPASVSGTSEGRGDYFAYKPALNLTFSSTSLALGAIPQDWSSAKHGFNAISTLVNSPHKKSAPPKAHSSVPLVSSSYLPRVRRKDFDSYLKSVGPEWDKFREDQKQDGHGEAASDFAAGLAELDVDFRGTPHAPVMSSSASMPALETVPHIFFQKDFDLSEANTFSSATGNVMDPGGSDTDESGQSQQLLDTLSYYADTIELHLVREISLRSTSFFAALSNLNDLQTESSQCLDRIRNLRGVLRDVGEDEAKKGLEIVRLERKLNNLNEVRSGIKSMHAVGETLVLAQNLASGGEWDTALSLLEQTQKLYVEEGAVPRVEHHETQPPAKQDKLPKRNSTLRPVHESIVEEDPEDVATPSAPAPLPLASLQAFSALPDHLRSLTLEIASSLSSEFVSTLRTDLLGQMDQPFTGHSAAESAEDRFLALKDKLRPLIRGLLRTESLKDALVKWTSVALIEMRACVKKQLPSSEDLEDAEQISAHNFGTERGASLREQLLALSHEDFMSLIRKVYAAMEGGIHELQVQSSLQQDVLDDLHTSFPFVDLESLRNDLTDILSSVIEVAHSRASKILSIRAEQHASLDMQDFLEVFNETWDFVIRTETICRKMFVSLRGTIVSQAKAFLQSMHQKRISQSAKLVEEEQWSAADVSSSVQFVANVIVDSAVRDSPELQVPSPHANGSPSTSKEKQLAIEDRKYFAVSATQNTLSLIVDYLKIIVNLSLLTTDTVSKVIEFLKAFNSRTCQVVLGAGAMRSAGLKNITAKHLALASQSLSIVIALVPYVRECFRRHLNAKQAVMLVEFDKLKRDYQEHQHEIHAKLVAIMGDRLTAHCKSLQQIDWSGSRDQANDYIVLLVKETVTLHKVLSRYLQEGVLEYIMTQVFAAINHRLSEEYSKIELQDQAAKNRLLRDATYLKQQFSGLKNVNSSASLLETVVKDKPLASAPASSRPSAQPNNATPSSPRLDATQSTPSPPPAQPPFRSANERLRNMFRRSSAVPNPEPTTSSTNSSPVAENPPPSPLSVLTTGKALNEEPANDIESYAPPPIPEKLTTGDDLVRSTLSPVSSRPNSPFEGRPRSPRVLEKALPIPVPLLDENGNIVDHPDSPRPSGEGRDLDEEDGD